MTKSDRTKLDQTRPKQSTFFASMFATGIVRKKIIRSAKEVLEGIVA